ncbi:hypothetical protein FOA52_011526 [Chlamydomonas sp. UWO 241]|nr:hypothetical protein FOA52_011526 [Chlamydomonas sp. UWO 241]
MVVTIAGLAMDMDKVEPSSSYIEPSHPLKKKSFGFHALGGDDAGDDGARVSSGTNASASASVGGLSRRSGSTVRSVGAAGRMDASDWAAGLREEKTSAGARRRRRRRRWARFRAHMRPSYWLHVLDKTLPIINPMSPGRIAWDSWMLTLVVYVCFMIPYSVGFGFHHLYLPPFLPQGETYPAAYPAPPAWPPAPDNLEPTPLMDNLAIWAYIVDAFFWCDLLSNFRTGFIDATATLVRDGGAIARNYLKLWFWVDLCACIPFDQIILLFVSGLSTDQLTALLLLRTLRLLRLARLLRVLERMKTGVLIRVVKLLFFITLIVHWVACLWFFIFRMTYIAIGHPWSFNEQVAPGSSSFTYFLQAFYNTFELMIGNDIIPGNSIEQLYCCFVMGLGACFYAIILGSISLLVTNMDPGATRHRLKRDIIHNTLRYLGMKPAIVNKVSEYYDYLLARAHPGPDGMGALQQLPSSMFRDISVFLYYEDVKKVPLFKDCEDAFIRALVMRLKLQVYLAGEAVFFIGDVGHDMYFITKGFVAVSNTYNEMLAVLPKGAFFGELGMLATAHRTASCTALCECDISLLTASDLLSAMGSFPESARIVRERSVKRLKELQAAGKADGRRAAAAAAIADAEEEEAAERAVAANAAAAAAAAATGDAGAHTGIAPPSLLRGCSFDGKSARGSGLARGSAGGASSGALVRGSSGSLGVADVAALSGGGGGSGGRAPAHNWPSAAAVRSENGVGASSRSASFGMPAPGVFGWTESGMQSPRRNWQSAASVRRGAEGAAAASQLARLSSGMLSGDDTAALLDALMGQVTGANTQLDGMALVLGELHIRLEAVDGHAHHDHDANADSSGQLDGLDYS